MAKPRIVVEGGGSNLVRVHVSGETLYNLEATQRLSRSVLGRLGCPGCCSGIQILFQQVEQELPVE
jgi:hypothetical protein